MQVLYIDFGNSATLSFDKVLDCNPKFKKVPPQVMSFCLEDFKGSSDDHEMTRKSFNYQKILQIFLITYYNQTVDMQVIEHYGDMVIVRIIDDQFDNIRKSIARLIDK